MAVLILIHIYASRLFTSDAMVVMSFDFGMVALYKHDHNIEPNTGAIR